MLLLLLNLAPASQAQQGGGVVNRKPRRTAREGGYGYLPSTQPAQPQVRRDDEEVLLLCLTR